MPKRKKISRDIREATDELRKIFMEGLSPIAEQLIQDLMTKWKRAIPSQRINVTKKTQLKGKTFYSDIVLKAVSEISLYSYEKAQSDFKAKNLKLALPTEFKKLPPELQRKVKRNVDLLVMDQFQKLETAIYFQYGSSFDTTDSEEIIREDLEETAKDFITGNVIRGGASATAAKAVNEARSAFFYQDDTLEQIEAFRFVNGDPVSPICTDLQGTIFSKTDANKFRYTPPLHFDCKSYIEPIYKGDLKSRNIEKLKPSKKSLEKYIQF